MALVDWLPNYTMQADDRSASQLIATDVGRCYEGTGPLLRSRAAA